MARKPKDPDHPKTQQISFRLTEAMLTRLREAAAAGNNSLTDEVEQRLRRSFEKEDKEIAANFGSAQTFAVCLLASRAIDYIEAMTDHRWYNNRFTHVAAAEAMATVFDAFRPNGRTVMPAEFPAPEYANHPELRRAVRLAFANKPWGEVVAKIVIASMQASLLPPHIANRLGRRLTKPVLPLPKTAEEEAHNARITARAKGEVK
jgi:hypothetical protein